MRGHLWPRGSRAIKLGRDWQEGVVAIVRKRADLGPRRCGFSLAFGCLGPHSTEKRKRKKNTIMSKSAHRRLFAPEIPGRQRPATPHCSERTNCARPNPKLATSALKQLTSSFFLRLPLEISIALSTTTNTTPSRSIDPSQIAQHVRRRPCHQALQVRHRCVFRPPAADARMKKKKSHRMTQYG